MDLNSILSPRAMVGAAIVGIVGAAGVFIYEQVYAERRRAMLITEVARLDRQVATMRSELETLRELQKESQLRRLKHKKSAHRREKKSKPPVAGGDAVDAPEQSYASDSEYFTDYQSVLGTDGELDSEEFYDVHTDEEDDTLRETLHNGHVTNALDDDTASLPKSPRKNGPAQ
ncbi:uncharacterized protein LOC128681888 [Plodia interpunctella]|uniref:uncharacterized protein LOC128681888 n=1 Tax=Plodia interpunctella TaxID=58824 RepID=UPI00236891F1|nr:uncharacterized protein LOC128681888 [Plodia interpunctella]